MGSKHRRRKRKPDISRRTAPGASPGSVVVDPNSKSPLIHVIAYGPEGVEERTCQRLEEIPPLLKKWPVTWVNVDGLGDLATLEKLGEMFQLHRLELEDVVNVHQRSKVEQYGDHLFIVARMVTYCDCLETEQVSIFLGKNFVLTFQENLPGDSFNSVRERIRQNRGRIRSAGPDYLAYALLDAVIDGYFPVVERYGERIEEIEDAVLELKGNVPVKGVHEVRRDLLLLRRAMWPHRETLSWLSREHNPLISNDTRIYLRDCYDHTVQLIDLLETYRELGSDLHDHYLTAVSTRLNEIMKVLTAFATLFMPLTFIVGVYGMNFDTEVSPWNMPELKWYYGYPAVWAVMVAVTIGMLVYFRRKGWLGSSRETRT